MKRQKRKAKRANRNNKPDVTVSAAKPPDQPNRRDFLRKVRNGGLIAAAVGGGGWYLVSDVSATIREHDLTQIGNGTPAVFQIHDPDCPRCLALQRATRDALGGFDDGELQYLVADITRPEGRGLATAHGVNHVTLLLFDADGERRGVLVGEQTSDYLEQVFRRTLFEGGSS